jgi:hypothetical protein
MPFSISIGVLIALFRTKTLCSSVSVIWTLRSSTKPSIGSERNAAVASCYTRFERVDLSSSHREVPRPPETPRGDQRFQIQSAFLSFARAWADAGDGFLARSAKDRGAFRPSAARNPAMTFTSWPEKNVPKKSFSIRSIRCSTLVF